EERRPQEAAGDRGQGDQAPPGNRRPRLRDQDALDDPLSRGGRQGQGDPALPRARDGAPGTGGQGARPREGRDGRQGQGRAVPPSRRPPDGDGAGAEVGLATIDALINSVAVGSCPSRTTPLAPSQLL